MENRKTMFDYLSQVFVTFGITILILNMFCYFVGEEAKGYSTIFQLGKNGLAFSTTIQFFAISILLTGISFFFFTDRFIKKMGVAGRTIGMVLTNVLAIAVFASSFGWFPVDDLTAWAMFFLSFLICFLISAVVSVTKERMENRALERALKKLQEGKDE